MLYGERLARLHRTTAEEESAAFEYLRKYGDKEYSAVDCLSFVVMEGLGIREALAFDSDFGHRFVTRPGPARYRSAGQAAGRRIPRAMAGRRPRNDRG
jgi:predicted nucleic acid-binding protein